MADSEMVIRVARALFEQSVAVNGFDGTWDDLEGASQDRFAALARVAIKAMREPSWLMECAGDSVLAAEHAGQGAKAWKAMVFAALRFNVGQNNANR